MTDTPLSALPSHVTGRYKESVGRRKRAVARVRYFAKGEGEILVNDQPYRAYFPTFQLQQFIEQPFTVTQMAKKGTVTVHVAGGGKKSQAEAVRLGIARVLVDVNEENKKLLKAEGFLTRDARKKERKKPGLKRARRAPQWQKR